MPGLLHKILFYLLALATLFMLASCSSENSSQFNGSPLIATTQLHISEVGDINTPNTDGFLPIIYAAYFDDVNAVRHAIQNGAFTNERGVGGYSALHWSAAKNNTTSLQELLLHDVDINIVNDHGETPLFLALKHGHVDAARTLLDFGASPFIATNYRQTGFSLFNSQPSDIQEILIRNSEIGTRSVSGYSNQRSAERDRNLRVAAAEGRVDRMNELLREGAQINTRSAFGRTPLIFAVKNGHFDAVRLLLSYEEIRTEISDRYNKSAYDYAMELGFPYIAEYIGIAIRLHETN